MWDSVAHTEMFRVVLNMHGTYLVASICSSIGSSEAFYVCQHLTLASKVVDQRLGKTLSSGTVCLYLESESCLVFFVSFVAICHSAFFFLKKKI